MYRHASTVLATSIVAAGLSSAPAAAGEWIATDTGLRPEQASGVTLTDITALSPTDRWTVGSSTVTATSTMPHSLTAHWDGVSWHIVPTPDKTTLRDDYHLTAVDALSAHEVWAVGSHRYIPESGILDGHTTTYIMRYDGNAWSAVPSPSPTTAGSVGVLTDVDMVSATDGWAVGSRGSMDGNLHVTDNAPLIMRWQAGQWTQMAIPPMLGYLNAVHASAADDVWAVGNAGLVDSRPLVMHWDGIEWSVMDSPAFSVHGWLNDVTSVSGTDVWAVGQRYQSITGGVPLALHLVDGQWQEVPTAPLIGRTAATVAVLSPTDVWIAGYSFKSGEDHNLVEHWDGNEFTNVPVPLGTTGPYGSQPLPGGTLGQPASAITALTAIPGTNTLSAAGWSKPTGHNDRPNAQILNRG